jgi:hypothetical protein
MEKTGLPEKLSGGISFSCEWNSRNLSWGGLRLVMELFGILEGGIRQRCVYGGEGEMYEECGGWRRGTELLLIMMQMC